MKLMIWFKRLTLSNRLGVFGSIASVIGIPLAIALWYVSQSPQGSINTDMAAKINYIHGIVGGVDQNVRQLQRDISGLQAGSTTHIEYSVSDLVEVPAATIPLELQSDFQTGKIFYERYLKKEFPILPERFFVRVLRIRATPQEARAVSLDILAERSLLGVFWVYQDYGTVNHSRSFEPPHYYFSVAPLLSQKAMRVYLIDKNPFPVPAVTAGEWIR